ncbi:hypothetical protein IQ07DRAFT_659884 [Pyrenochaeta sp. DS3sAY3a]|nr:hypothetical protein IQ07DRAFT_659884 [Pyrenochaeta sp. DS3sAY3a]
MAACTCTSAPCLAGCGGAHNATRLRALLRGHVRPWVSSNAAARDNATYAMYPAARYLSRPPPTSCPFAARTRNHHRTLPGLLPCASQLLIEPPPALRPHTAGAQPSINPSIQTPGLAYRT